MDIEALTSRLGPAQKNAVLSDAPYLRIVASAGAGKTETMTRKIVYLLAQGEEPRSIIAFTFTKRAAHEIKERIYWRVEKLLGPERCKELGDMYVGTIHGFCLQLLQDRFGYGNFDILDENQEMAFVLRHGWGLGLQKVGNGNYSANCDTFIRSTNVVYDELIDRERLNALAPDFAKDLEQYEVLLDDNRLLTFGRIIYLAASELSKAPEIDCKHLIVDEYQDINRAQERLIQLIARSSNCYIVGDPRQCIYEWRGSDPECFERFAESFKSETREILENRRSGASIVQVGNKIAANFEEESLRTPMDPSSRDNGSPYEGVATCVEHDTDQDEALWIASQIQRLTAEGVCDYSDVAVLLRSVTTSGPKILDALKQADIPYLVGGRVGLFKRDEARAVGMIFTWCGDMFWKVDRYSRETLSDDALLAEAMSLWPGTVSEKVLRDFKEKILSGEYPSFVDAYNDLLVRLGFLDWDPSDRQVAARMANLGRFSGLLVDFAASRRRGGRQLKWKTDLRNLAWFISSYALGAYEEQPAEDIRGVDAVQVMTVHQAKGLEWAIVFVPALVQRRFPSSNTGAESPWFVPNELFDQDRYEGSVEDERKLFYVAITRARDALCLSYFRRLQRTCQRSQFLNEIGASALEPAEALLADRIRERIRDEQEIVGFSATEIIEYLKCPTFYRLKNLWNYQRRLVPEIGFGKSIHHVLRVLAERARDGADPVPIVDEVVEEHFHLPFGTSATRAILEKQAKSALLKYAKSNREDLRSVKEVEARLEFQLTKTAIVTGRADVIIGAAGELEVRDYKTYRATTDDDSRTQEEATLQVQLYSIGLREVGQPVNRGSVALVLDNSIRAVPISDAELEKARAEAMEAVSGILKKDFGAKPGKHCADCGYRPICRFRAN